MLCSIPEKYAIKVCCGRVYSNTKKEGISLHAFPKDENLGKLVDSEVQTYLELEGEPARAGSIGASFMYVIVCSCGSRQ